MKITSFIPLIFVLSSDDLGRLKTEINMEDGDQKTQFVDGQKIEYTYGNSGDIVKREYYDVQASLGSIFTRQTVVRTDSFGYTNSNWKNQCDSTNINGVSSALSYDAIGNPLTYRDGMQMTWQNGRQLKKLTAPNGKMLQFFYDINGQRQTKVERNYGNVIHSTHYFYDGTKLAGEKKDDTIVWYDYDENGSPVGMRVNGLDYIFRKNLQGDITGIYNSSAELIVEYTYSDAWGAGVTVSGSAASTIGMYNSFRYRGYYYDTESGLYYLNSRYYDPVACRFINGDSLLNPDIACGKNLYVYAEHNPVNKTDSTGTWAFIDDAIAFASGAIAGAVGQFISDVVTGEFSSWETYAGAAFGGGVGGVVSLYAGPVCGAAVGSGLSTATTLLLENASGKAHHSVGEIASKSLAYAGTGALLSCLPFKCTSSSQPLINTATYYTTKHTLNSILKKIAKDSASNVMESNYAILFDVLHRTAKDDPFIVNWFLEHNPYLPMMRLPQNFVGPLIPNYYYVYY